LNRTSGEPLVRLGVAEDLDLLVFLGRHHASVRNASRMIFRQEQTFPEFFGSVAEGLGDSVEKLDRIAVFLEDHVSFSKNIEKDFLLFFAKVGMDDRGNRCVKHEPTPSDGREFE
jgi:hypothetical protein